MNAQAAKIWAPSILGCAAILLIAAITNCSGQEIDLAGHGWRKHAVYIGHGKALTTYHGDTGHEMIAESPEQDWRVIRVKDDYPVANRSPAPLRVGEKLWCRGKWGVVTQAGFGEFYTTHEVIRGDSGAGLYRRDGTCAGIVTHKLPIGARCVRW